ncbi:MAG TPA: S41 family peptidase [Planctomycetaceae bacterium]|nr:S41 family peptidase [Planctomycetaceae bacterium]
MTRLWIHFGKQIAAWFGRAVVVAVATAVATPALAQYGNDFGAAPDSYLGQSDSTYDRWDAPAPRRSPAYDDSYPQDRLRIDRPFDDRYGAPLRNDFDRMLDNYGRSGSDRFDRDFDLGNRLDDRGQGRSRDSFGGRDRWELSRRSPVDQGGFDPFPTSRQRVPYDRMPEYDRVPQYGPAVPAAPASTLNPSLEQKIAKRYEDPRVLRVLGSLDQQRGEAFYMEVAQLIDARHIEPTSYAQRTQAALRQLSIAAETPSFQQAVGLRAGSQNVRQFQQALQQMQAQANVRTANDAIAVMRQAGAAANQMLGINPAAVALEFVYASLDTLDQYSMFVPPEKSGSPSVGLENNIVGIGVELETHPQGLMILKVLSGGPAAQATLRRGDIITAVGGQSTAGMDLGRAVELITGPEGSTVPLTIRRDDLVGDTTLMRQRVTIYSVADVRMEDPTNRIGYIKIEKFAESTTQELDAALWQLQQQGMESLVLDLRGNPGGLLTTAISVSDRFLPQGTIVSTRGRNAADNSQEVARKENTWKVPLVVLIDHNSASASEIFAAAIQDNGRGVVVGERSYGKGTVQTLFPIQSVGSALRLTTAKFYSPKGVAMAGVGVSPDVPVQAIRNDVSATDRALQTAVDVARDPRTRDLANGLARTGSIGSGIQG